MSKIDAMIAPRALLAEEVASVIAPQLVVYGLAYRAFTEAVLWDAADEALTVAAESVTAGIATDADASLKQWLSDMQADGQPRFYQAAGLKRAISDLLMAAGNYITGLPLDQLETAVMLISDRNPATMRMLISKAGD